MASREWYIEQKIEVTNAILLRIERILIEIRDGKKTEER